MTRPRTTVWADDLEYQSDVERTDSGGQDDGLHAEATAATGIDKQFRKLVFDGLADELAMSVSGIPTDQAMSHPAYAEILELGPDAVEFLIERLATPGFRPLWLRLLSSLTPYQPGAGKATIEEAAQAWMRWSLEAGVGPS